MKRIAPLLTLLLVSLSVLLGCGKNQKEKTAEPRAAGSGAPAAPAAADKLVTDLKAAS
jgi:hypothetical protein